MESIHVLDDARALIRCHPERAAKAGQTLHELATERLKEYHSELSRRRDEAINNGPPDTTAHKVDGFNSLHYGIALLIQDLLYKGRPAWGVARRTPGSWWPLLIAVSAAEDDAVNLKAIGCESLGEAAWSEESLPVSAPEGVRAPSQPQQPVDVTAHRGAIRVFATIPWSDPDGEELFWQLAAFIVGRVGVWSSEQPDVRASEADTEAPADPTPLSKQKATVEEDLLPPSTQEAAVEELLLALPVGQALTGPEIENALAALPKPGKVFIDPSYFRRKIVPRLKARGLINKPKRGYFYPADCLARRLNT